MSTCVERLLYLKQLYFSVGQVVLSKNYSIFTVQLDYIYAEKEYQKLLQRLETETCIQLCDKNSVLFNYLMNRLIDEKFTGAEIVFLILSPFYKNSVIDHVFIPEKKLKISNCYRDDDFSPFSGYLPSENSHISDYNFSVANEFFEKAQKI